MMKKVALAVLAVALVNSYALGATVSFDPAKHSVNVNTGSQKVEFLVTIIDQGNLASMQTIDVILGSNDGLQLKGFQYAEFNPVPNFIFPPAPSAKYQSGIVLGLANFFPGYGAPLTLGVLSVTVDTDALPLGKYEVVINSENDGGQTSIGEGVALEGLFGVGSINIVVPEPATISLLGFAALALIRRRRNA